jgi:hypothetical protein
MENAIEEPLARVGPGTPSGEVFRRYWLPVETSANLGGRRGEFLGTRNPLRIRVLGETTAASKRTACAASTTAGSSSATAPASTSRPSHRRARSRTQSNSRRIPASKLAA